MSDSGKSAKPPPPPQPVEEEEEEEEGPFNLSSHPDLAIATNTNPPTPHPPPKKKKTQKSQLHYSLIHQNSCHHPILSNLMLYSKIRPKNNKLVETLDALGWSELWSKIPRNKGPAEEQTT
jgi:hypothetical protein